MRAARPLLWILSRAGATALLHPTGTVVHNRIPTCVFIVAPLAAFAAPASAQRATLTGQFGTTFQTETAPVFAGEIGVGLVPGVSIYGTLGRMQDVMPNSVVDLIGNICGF